MKLKILITCVAAALCAFMLLFPQHLGNMSRSFTEPETGCCDVIFYGKPSDKIKISLSSDIQSGSLDIVIYDSDGNIAEQLDSARELCTYFIPPDSGLYTLKAEYTGLTGSFDVKIA